MSPKHTRINIHNTNNMQKKPAFYDYDRRFDYDYAIYNIIIYTILNIYVVHIVVYLYTNSIVKVSDQTNAHTCIINYLIC